MTNEERCERNIRGFVLTLASRKVDRNNTYRYLTGYLDAPAFSLESKQKLHELGMATFDGSESNA